MGKHTRLALSPLAVKTCKTEMRRKRHFEGNKFDLFASILSSHSSPDPSQQPRQRSQSFSGKYLGSLKKGTQSKGNIATVSKYKKHLEGNGGLRL